MTRRRTLLSAALAAALFAGPLFAAGGRGSIVAHDLEAWLTYLSSDGLEGRAVFSEGLGLAAGYIQSYLPAWGVKPAGDEGRYLQVVKVDSVRATSRSSVTVQVGRESRTFKDGEGITFPRNAGAPRRLTIDTVEFAGYGLDLPALHYSDLAGKAYRGAAVIYLGSNAPQAVNSDISRRILYGRARWLSDHMGAGAVIGPPSPFERTDRQSQSTPSDGGDGSQNASRADFTNTGRLDHRSAPDLNGSDAFFQFLFSKAPVRYDDLKKRADAREPLTPFRLDNVRITIDVDVDYTILRTRLTQNIVGVVEGSDPELKSTYVALGAHYDHVGYSETDPSSSGNRGRVPGRVSASAPTDRIWNGADDDGSGTVALMALARAFAQGPRPKRSILFVWHAGEESGLYGSRYFADFPTVPIDKVVAQLNIDMIGRNRDDKADQADTVYLVGSDRISTELDDISRQANRALDQPLTLDYEMNDPADPEQVYFRSDHYSYASKGIPVIFFTTGLHQDYHANTDEVSKILFPKLTRVAELVYETAWRLGNLDHAPVRDFKGPRAGKGTLQ